MNLKPYIFILITLWFCFSKAEPAAQAAAGMTGQLTDLQFQAIKGQGISELNAIQFGQNAAIKYEHGGECGISCPLGCCDAANGLTVEGGMYTLLNAYSIAEAKQEYIAAMYSCKSYNQQSTTQKNCGAEVKPVILTMPEKNWLNDAGLCKPSAPADCTIIMSVPGSEIYRSSLFKGKNGEGDFYSAYKKNMDGSIRITTKDKVITLNMDSFKDRNSLLAAGVSANQVDSLLAQFQKNRALVANTRLSSPLLNSSQKSDQSFSPSTSEQEILSAKNMNGSHQQQKSPREAISYDSLTHDFNGESIHVAGCDIFHVIAIKYKSSANLFFEK